MHQQAIIVGRSPNFTTAVLRNMTVTLWHRNMTVQGVESGELGARMAAQYGRPILASLLESLHTPPPEDVRRALLHSLNYLSPLNPRGCTVVLEGTGLLLAGARSIASGLLMAARPTYPMRVHATVGEASIWLGGLPGLDRQAAADFCNLVAQARLQIMTAASA